MAGATEQSNKEARGPAQGSGREKRKATADATERSQKQARAAETAKGKRDAKKRKRASGTERTVVYVDNGKGGERSLLRTVTVSSLMRSTEWWAINMSGETGATGRPTAGVGRSTTTVADGGMTPSPPFPRV